MRKRIYYLVPDRDSGRQTVDVLRHADVAERHIHVLADDKAAVRGLPAAGIAQSSDIVHGAELGLLVGALTGGVAAGLMAWWVPPGGAWWLAVLLATAVGAVYGPWAAAMVACSLPNSRLEAFRAALARGQLLLMVDVPSRRVAEVEALLESTHPEATLQRVESPLRAWG